MKFAARKSWTRFLAVPVVSAAFPLQASAQSALLKPSLEAGRTVYVERNERTVQTITGDLVGEQGMAIVIDQTSGVLQRVESVAAAGVKLKMTFDRVRMEFDAAMMKGVFDSDARSAVELLELAEVFEPMIGAAYTAELDRDFNVMRIVGVDELAAKLTEAGGANRMAPELLRGMSNEQYKATLAESIFMLYPNKKVKLGDTWSKSIQRKGGMLGEMGVKYEYRVESINDKQVVVAYIATLTRAPDAKADTGNPMIKDIKFESGSIKGKARFDTKSGQLVGDARKALVKMVIAMDMPGGEGDAAPSMNIVSEIDRSLKFMTTKQRAAQRAESKKKTAQSATDG